MSIASFRKFLQALAQLPAMGALSARIYPQRNWRAMRLRLRLIWHMCRHLPEHLAGLALFERPLLREVAARHPRIHRKIYNDYPCSGLSVAERAARMRTHYELLDALLPPSILPAVLLDCNAELCRVPLPQGRGLLTVRLIHAHHYEREGELSLVLHDPFGTALYALTFSFERVGAQTGILIGALQGQLPLEVSRDLTKYCLGVRPPNLLFFALQVLARELGLQSLRAVGRSRHVYEGTSIARNVHFDYDAFWSSLGGEPTPEGFLQLPLQARRRTHEEIPGNKRSQYARRYAWLDLLEADMRGWLAKARSTPAAAPAGRPC